MTRIPLEISHEVIAGFCRRWRIRELALFGSVLREHFRPDSDIDLLVTFEPGAGWSLLDVIAAEEELAELLGRPVDLIERSTVEASENWIRREHILKSARTLYAG